MTMARQAFTLIEMLVVIGVLSVLVAIGYGGLINSRGNEGLESVSSLMSNLVRQARHTAMSTGAPVELQITGNTTSGFEIRGITQSPLYGQQFDSDQDLSNLAATTTELDLGHAGYGLPIGLPKSWTATQVRPELIRSDEDSFLIECSFRPPSDLQDIIAQNIDFISLLSIDTSGAGTPLLDLGVIPPTRLFYDTAHAYCRWTMGNRSRRSR